MAAMEGGGSEPRRVIARRYEDLGFIDGSWIMGYRLWFMSYWLWVMGYRLWITGWDTGLWV